MARYDHLPIREGAATRRSKAAVVSAQKSRVYEVPNPTATPGTKAAKLNLSACSIPTIPAQHLQQWLSALRCARRTYVVVAEEGYFKRSMTRRVGREVGWHSLVSQPKSTTSSQ